MARRLYRVYIDESGDRGMTAQSSPFFVVAAVMVRDDHDIDLRTVRDQICTDLGKPVATVLHWAENIKKHDQRKHVAGLLGDLAFIRVTYVIVDKAGVRASGGSGLTDHTRMYNYAIRRALERISWCINARDGEAILTFAHVRRFPYAKLNSYLAYLRGIETEIKWAAFSGKPRIDQQSRVQLLQVADIAAGCLAAALTPDPFGGLEPAYLERIRPVIYSRPPGAITSYGMNVIGDKQAPSSLTSRLPWWSAIFN